MTPGNADGHEFPEAVPIPPEFAEVVSLTVQTAGNLRRATKHQHFAVLHRRDATLPVLFEAEGRNQTIEEIRQLAPIIARDYQASSATFGTLGSFNPYSTPEEEAFIQAGIDGGTIDPRGLMPGSTPVVHIQHQEPHRVTTISILIPDGQPEGIPYAIKTQSTNSTVDFQDGVRFYNTKNRAQA